MKYKDMPFVLASTSPRRKELLTRFGVKFTVAKSSFEESHEQWPDPVAYVEAQARGKAAHVIMGENEPDEYIVLGADTIVAWNGELLGNRLMRLMRCACSRSCPVRPIRLLQVCACAM